MKTTPYMGSNLKATNLGNQSKNSDTQLEDENIEYCLDKNGDRLIIFNGETQINLDECIRQAVQESRKGMIKIEDVNKMIDEIKNPYPTDIFPEITEKTFKDIQKVLNEKFLGFPFDRISANLMRRARNILKDELKQSLKNLGDK